MATSVKYGGVDVFGDQPTPFFSKGVEFISYGSQWVQAETISLVGMITGCSESFLRSERSRILNAFSESFKTLEIDGAGTYPTCRIQSLDFPDSDYYSSVPYTITLLIYPEASFKTFLGVLDPVDQISYQEQEDRTASVIRTISARGVTTENGSAIGNGLANAIAFVQAQAAKTNHLPAVINSNGSDIKLILQSSEENFNRITNTASINQQYVTDLNGVGDYIHRQTTTIQEQDGEYPIVKKAGYILAGRKSSIGVCRDGFDAMLSGQPSQAFLDKDITEDPYVNKLDYSFSYYQTTGGYTIPDVEDNFSISLSESSDSSLIPASINGSVSSRMGCFVDMESGVREIASGVSGSFHYNIMRDLYTGFYSSARGCAIERPSNVDLNTAPIEYTVSDPSDGTDPISYSASFNDRYIPADSTANSFSDAINVSPSEKVIQISEHYKGGKYTATDLGYYSRRRTSISLAMQGDVTTDLQSRAISMYNQLKGGALDSYQDSVVIDNDEINSQSCLVAYSDRTDEDDEVFL